MFIQQQVNFFQKNKNYLFSVGGFCGFLFIAGLEIHKQQ